MRLLQVGLVQHHVLSRDMAHVSGLLSQFLSLVGDQPDGVCLQAVHHGRGPCTCLGCPSSHTPPEAGCLQETLPVLPGMLQPEQAARAQQPPPI